MKKVEKINLRGISEILSEKEMKNVMGGSITCSCNGNSVLVDTNQACCKMCNTYCS